ncbi:serine protease inhibitor 42Dd-like [Drosophila montana]|uniref:serine protease inhibitor 42Dd-like n=1 Tax=Drosophila montana TaxID=40370 RepID=UPI00313BEA09
MMGQVGRFKSSYIMPLDADCLELPYKDSMLSLVILLPRELDGINRLVEDLDDLHPDDIPPESDEQRMAVLLPKFKFDFEAELSDVVNNLGAKSLFRNANMESMTDDKRPLRISNIFQKAVFELDDEDAAPATAEEFNRFLPRAREDIIVNHPFVFLVKDESRIYFAGRVINPQ